MGFSFTLSPPFSLSSPSFSSELFQLPRCTSRLPLSPFIPMFPRVLLSWHASVSRSFRETVFKTPPRKSPLEKSPWARDFHGAVSRHVTCTSCFISRIEICLWSRRRILEDRISLDFVNIWNRGILINNETWAGSSFNPAYRINSDEENYRKMDDRQTNESI